ncbi:phospholipase-like protein [Tanacetum coccineum]
MWISLRPLNLKRGFTQLVSNLPKPLHFVEAIETLQLLDLSGGSMPDYYSNGVRYPVAWRDVEKVYFPVNEPKKHWCLAELHISSGVVTFYDTLGYVCENRRPWWQKMKRNLLQQLTEYLNEHGVLESKGISVESLSCNLPLTVKDPLQTALAYREQILEYFWRHKIEAKPSVLPDEDYIPFEMQIEIMNRLPVKSLLQFRTVSKSWKSCIDSSTFFFNYVVHKSINDVFYLTYNHGFQGTMISVDENLIHTPVLRNLIIANLKPIVIDIPDLVMRGLSVPLYVSNLQDSLVLSGNIPTPAYYVFVCCQFSIDGGSITLAPAIMTMPSHHFLKLLGFNNHDLPIVEAAIGHIMGHTVQVYMENSQSFENVTIQGNAGSFFIGAYKESLILAAYPNHSLHYAG